MRNRNYTLTEGDDLFFGGNQGQQIAALGGNDVVHGGNGRDTISGGAGNDLLSGGNGNDAIGGGVGNDTLIGGNGNDTMWGDEGVDVLIGGRGADLFGLAADYVRLPGGQYNNVAVDFNGAEGDRIWLGGATANARYLARGATEVDGGITITDGVRVQLLQGVTVAEWNAHASEWLIGTL